MKVRLGEAISVQPDKRLHDHVMDSAMGDVIDALVELITNADDSYGRLYRARRQAKNRGQILIERCEQRRGSESSLIVRDRAEGMTLERMIEVLKSPGALTSSSGDRGYMGRGAKDCARFGSLTVESIKDGRYACCILTKRAKEVIPKADAKADVEMRTRLGVAHGNGTKVTLEVGEEYRIPQIKTLSEELSCHYALQDILDEERGGEILLRNGLRLDEKPERLVARRPACETVCEGEQYVVPGYEGAVASLSIYRVEEPFEERPPRTRRYGFLIAGERAIHERSALDNVIERDPNSRRYFGRIECHHIDKLMGDYESRRKSGQRHPESNPRLLVDPGRRHGLEKDHPFTKALFELPISRIRELLEDDRKKTQAKRKQIGNRETRERLDRLARAASQFMQQQLDDLEVLGTDEDVDDDSFVRSGVLIYPTYLNVEVGRERVLTVYVNKALVEPGDEVVTVLADGSGLLVVDSEFDLRPHKHKDDRWYGTFRVRGTAVASDICISAKCDGLPPAKAVAQVIECKPVDRVFGAPLEFEHDEYRVRSNSQRTIKLFAKVPEIVRGETDVFIGTNDATAIGLPGRCRIVPVDGTNYAIGEVPIKGRRLKAKAVIRAALDGQEAKTEVKIVDRREDTRGPRFEFKLVPEEFGAYRAMWGDHEGKPNLLLIAGLHESLRRYVGAADADGAFPGEDNPIYRALLAEIVAEAVCRKSLQLEARERSWDFRWADLKDDEKIANDVVSRLQQRLREFLPIAHRILVRESDATQPVIIDSI